MTDDRSDFLLDLYSLADSMASATEAQRAFATHLHQTMVTLTRILVRIGVPDDETN